MPGIKLDVSLDDIFKTINKNAANQAQSMGLTARDDDFTNSFAHDIEYSIENPGHTYAADNYTAPTETQSNNTYSSQNTGVSDPFTSSPSSSAISSNEKWYAGDRPTYAESVARLSAMQGMLPPEQFNALTAELDKLKHDLSSGFYQNWYETITSPYVDAIAKLGIDVSGGINDDWIAKNQYLLQGARYTDAGTTPAAPTKNSTAAQNAAYYYYQIQRNYADTKEVLNEEAALKDEITYWVSRDDLNLSDQQIMDQLDWKGKYKYLQGLKDAQATGKRYNYTQPIDYNPDNLRGMIWAARNNGGTGNSELDAVNAALGRGNVWQENKEISGKLDFQSDNFSPYSVKSTLDDEARYFGVKEFAPGWAEEAAKSKIDWNNPEDVKHWQKVYNAESFTEQAEAEVKEIYNRIDTMIAAGITDPAVIEDGLWEKGLDGSAALNALKKLDASMVRPDKLEDTTRPIDYRKQDVLNYINQQCAKASEKESVPDFGDRVTDMLGTNVVDGNGQASAPIDVSAAVTPTVTPGVNPTARPQDTAVSDVERILNTPAPNGTTPPGPVPTPTPPPASGVNPTANPQEAGLSAADRILNTPAPNFTPTPTPTPMPTPAPVVDQSARAVNKAQTKNVLDAAKTILATGTPDEKQVLNLAPTVNAEGVAAEMANSVQNGKADAGSLYESTAKQAQAFTATHYVMAKMAIQHYEDLQANLANLQAQQAEIQKQHDQEVQYQADRSIVPGIATKEVKIDGETHVFTVDYDPQSKEYIVHDSNPTSSAEVERQKEEYANLLKNNLNMEETYAEKDNQLLVAAEDLNMQLTAINQQVAKAQKAVDDYKMRYDQAQGELKTSQSMINAAAMQSVWKAAPDMDLSTPEGQKALAKALDQQNTLTKSIDLLMGVSNTYVPTEWAATTVLDNMQANGFDSQQTGLAAKGIIGEANKELAALDQAEAAVQAAGISIPGDSNNIKRAREQAQQKKQEAEDYLLRRNEDFDQVVSDAKEAIQSDVDGKKYGALARYAVDPNLDQPTTTLAENLGMLAQAGNLNSYDAVQPHRQSYMDALTQEERDTYLYKLAKEGEQAAWDYYNRLGKYVDVRQTQAQNEELAAFAKDMPVLAAITSIGISTDTIKGAGYVAASLISGREINPYSKFFDTTWATSTLDQNAKEKILEPLEDGSLAKKIAGIGYDAITSGAKSLLNTALTAPLAGGSAFLGALPMGIQAAGTAAQQTKLTGGSDTQAALIAGVTLAAETLSETITTQNIAKAIDSGAKGVKGAMKKVLSNDMVEEFFGESVNQLVESVADDVVMGELSQRNQRIKEYEQTMSHEEAVRQADKDFWTDALAAGVTGALSAAGTSGISYAAGRLTVDNTTQPSAEGQVRATALANGLPLDRATVDMTNRTVSMLTASLNADKGSQVQALSAALFPVTGDAQGQRAAISAGLHMANQFGSEQAVAVAQDVILAAAQEGADQQAVKSAMTVAALGQGEASAVLNKISQNGVEFGDVQALFDASDRDAQNPAIADRMNAIIHNDRVSSRTRDLIGQGALNGVKPYEQAYSQAKAQEAQTQQNLEAEQERAQAMGENLKTVQAQHAENPSNPALAGAMKQAVKDVAGQVKVVGEYQQSLENQQQKTREAEKNLNRVREEAMTKVREQAMADVQAEEQVEAQAAAEAQAQAEAEAQATEDSNNMAAFDADAFINDMLKDQDVTPEERQKIIEMAQRIQSEFTPEAVQRRDKLVAQIGNKFGIDIVFADTTNGGAVAQQNGYYDRKNNRIVLDQNATVGDAMFRVLGHELTHAAEQSGTYEEMATALLRLRYGNDVGTFADILRGVADGSNRGVAAADVLGHQSLYNSRLAAMHEQDASIDVTPLTVEEAAHEVVSDIMGDILNGDADLIEQLAAKEPSLARRIIESIKNFLKKLTGMDGGWKSDAQRVVTMLENALKDNQNQTAQVQFSQPNETNPNYLNADGQPATNDAVEKSDTDAYVRRALDFDDPTLLEEFEIDGVPPEKIEKYRSEYVPPKAEQQEIAKPIVKNAQGADLADELRGGAVVRGQNFSISSWTEAEQERVRTELIKHGFAEEDVNKWIDNTNSIAAIIAADKSRLDFKADPTKTMLKPNAEYVKTLDASTLCAKRLLYQGTFNEIQHALPNTPLMPEDLIDLANMMREMGYETPCGICYVESRRRNLGKFADDWLKNYDGAYKPTLDQVTTTDGLQELKETHPATYQDFVNAMNKKGTMNPKVVQLRTDYRGEISDMTPGQIQKVKDIGGLRVQSFSDFETPHLLDMTQAVMDMASNGLTSQAYTKVPNFAWVFGDTGIKINMSLIGKGTGLDANGNLLFDDVEGMPFEEAMKIRDRYSKNVGTILVGINDAHILAAMADDRIDFIIPFHKSGWSKEELAKMPVLNSYSDYTDSQNEKKIVGRNNKGGYKTESLEKSKQVNFQPVGENGYWDFNKSGKENAETYLRMCAEDGRLPKFSQFLVDNGDGSFSLQPDGSTDGYWKTLIDFKMYDNEGNGSPQMSVTPDINMEEAQRVLNEYKGGADSLPVAQSVVDRYVEEYKAKNPRVQYSLPSDATLETMLRNYIANGGALSTRVVPPGGTTDMGRPMPSNSGSKQRQFGSQTAQRSNALHEKVKEYLREHSGYDPETNREQIARSIAWVQGHATEQDPDGYHASVAEAQGQDFNAYSADGQARMLTLMSMAALKDDVATETALADAYNQQGTVLGRALQARQIFNMMTPLGRQSILLKEVNRINQGYADKGKTTRVALSPDTLDKAGKAKTAEDFQRVQKQAYKELAEQMPPNWKDKLQAWRMLSMLGNPRTHVRNMLGNAIFMPAVKLKNVIGTALESAFVKPGSGEMRTKSLTVSKENRAFAKADAVKMKDTMTGEAKYNADRKVDQERKIFGTKDNFISRTFGKALQHVSDFNSWALEAEDWVFLRRHYENALGGWMQANKLTPDTITPEQLTQAREYAINEAQKATYRDASKVANWLSESSRKGGAIGWVVEAVLPFKKTPANILKRGIEYSPVGLMRAVTQDLANVKKYNDWVSNGSKGAMPKNALSPTQYIDRLSSGLSGTAITALGYMLASMGAVTVGLDDDKGELEELAGKQEYALNIRLGDIDVSYTVDWAAPVSLPFFVGASLFNATQGEIQNVEQVADALLSITEPVFNLSMLDGVNSLLNVSQWSSGNAMTQIGEKLATNYLSSYIPTALGQVSRTIDPVRRKSYVESGASLSTWRYALEQAQNKTPFSVSNIPYRNTWGDEDRSPEWLAAIENFISPGYINKLTPGKVEKELTSLYDETGDKKAVPQAASKSPYINGQQVKLNAEQYDQYTKVRGTTAKKLLEELIDRPEWAILDGNAKIDIVGEAWTYSNAVAAKDLFPDAKITAWIQTAQHEGNAAETIMNRHEEKAKKEYVDGYKTSLFEAVDEHDTEAFNTSMFALLDADKKEKEAQGKKQNPAYVNNLLVNHYKPLYITAINSGDAETVETIRDNLLSMPMAGIDAKTILSWQYEAQKQKVK